jgi:hypothetical protein
MEVLISELRRTGQLTDEQVADRLYVSASDLKTLRLPIEKIPADTPTKIPMSAKMPSFSITLRLHSKKEYDYVNSILHKIVEKEQCDQANATLMVFEAYNRKGL